MVMIWRSKQQWLNLADEFWEGWLKTIAYATWDNWIQANQDLIQKWKLVEAKLKILRVPKVFERLAFYVEKRAEIEKLHQVADQQHMT